MVDVTAIEDLVLGSLNAQTTETGYLIYGMAVTNQSVDVAIEMARRNLLAVVGVSAYNNPTNTINYESYITDMACMRLCINCLGIAIPTHFNYKSTNLSVSKNPNPSLEEMIRRYEKSIEQWSRFVLNTNWTGVETQDDLNIVKIIESSIDGVSYIQRDADPLQLLNYDNDRK
jgi:hypothetical protein